MYSQCVTLDTCIQPATAHLGPSKVSRHYLPTYIVPGTPPFKTPFLLLSDLPLLFTFFSFFSLGFPSLANLTFYQANVYTTYFLTNIGSCITSCSSNSSCNRYSIINSPY